MTTEQNNNKAAENKEQQQQEAQEKKIMRNYKTNTYEKLCDDGCRRVISLLVFGLRRAE